MGLEGEKEVQIVSISPNAEDEGMGMSTSVEELFAHEIETYESNLDALLGEADEHRRGWVLIKSHAVVGTYDTERDAIAEGYRHFGNNPFFVKQITPSYEPTHYLSPVPGR